MKERNDDGSSLGWHLLFLQRIYTFIGWLGLFGGGVLLFSLTQPEAMAATGATMPSLLPILLLIGWSTLLLSFARDLDNNRRWCTGIGGWCIGLFSLLSVPIGTAIGTYTIWVLIKLRQLPNHS